MQSQQQGNAKGALQLRKRMYSLLRSEDSPTFEKEYEKLLKEMQEKECMPPRSHFWDIGILVPPELRAKYNRIQPIEIPACIYMAFGLDKEEAGTVLSYDKGSEAPFLPLGHFSMEGLPDRILDRCLLSFGANTKAIHFRLKHASSFPCKEKEEEEEPPLPSTLIACMMDARQEVKDRILKVEETRVALSKKIKETMPSLVSLTDTPLHTHVDSDPGSEDENDDSEADPDAGEEEDDEEVKPSPSKRRKCLSDIGKGKDTPMQKVHFLGQRITPPSGVDSMRVREVKGDPEPHFMEIMGSIACDRNFRERLPVPKAPTFPDGTDPEDETKGVFYDTVLRQKMVDTDPSLAEDYEEMQRMALSMRKDLRSLVAFLKSSFTFCLRIEKKVEEEEEEDKEVPIQSLTVMQKLLLGQIYLRTISVCKGGEQSSEEEEEEEEESSSEDEEGASSEEEEEGSDEEYQEEDSEGEEEEEEEEESESEEY